MKKIFISYAHQDALFKDALVQQLKFLRSKGLIDDWHDSRIDAGEDWRAAIDEHLNAADIIVLLLSSDFLASDYCRDYELDIALKRWGERAAEIIPVIIRDCIWEASPLRFHQMLPLGPKPVNEWPHPDVAWKQVAQTVIRLATGAALAPPRITMGPDTNGGPANFIDHQELEEALHRCNRNKQERDLGEAVLRHRDASPRRPLVCLMHGEGKECHAQFVERLAALFLPQLLKRWYPERPDVIPCVRYKLPLALDQYARGNVEASIEWALASQHERDPSVYKTFAGRERCVLLHFTAFANDYSPADLKRFDEFLRYWRELDDLPPDRLLIVCVNFRYRNCQRGWKSVLRGRRIERRNRRVRKLVSELHNKETDGISFATLSELQPVRQEEVEILLDREKRLLRYFNLRTVNEMFNEEGSGGSRGHMHMEDVIDRLMEKYWEKEATPR